MVDVEVLLLFLEGPSHFGLDEPPTGRSGPLSEFVVHMVTLLRTLLGLVYLSVTTGRPTVQVAILVRAIVVERRPAADLVLVVHQHLVQHHHFLFDLVRTALIPVHRTSQFQARSLSSRRALRSSVPCCRLDSGLTHLATEARPRLGVRARAALRPLVLRHLLRLPEWILLLLNSHKILDAVPIIRTNIALTIVARELLLRSFMQ